MTITTKLILVIAWGISESPQSFSFQGRLFNASGTVPLEEPIQIEFKILDPSGSCLLYQETQSIDLTNESGVFSLSVGSAPGAPKRTVGMDPGLTMARVFKNDPTVETRAAHAMCCWIYTYGRRCEVIESDSDSAVNRHS